MLRTYLTPLDMAETTIAGVLVRRFEISTV